MKKNNKTKIAIIGGGYTGLVAAYKLSQKDYDVTIYEKSLEVGGLASGFEIQGTSLEKTYHHIFRTDTDIINLAKELGIEEKLLWLNSSMGIYYEGEVYKFGTPISLLKFKPLNIFNRVRYGLVLLYLAKTKNWRKFIKKSAYSWASKASGKQAMKVIWEPLLKGKFDRYYDKISMAWLWARVHTRGNSQEKGGEKLGYFDGGFIQFTNAIVEKLKENNVKIITGANITKIISDRKTDKVKVLVNGEDIVYDKLIATIPSHAFSTLIKDNSMVRDYLKKLNSIEYLGAIVMAFSSDQSIGEFYWNNINDLKSPFLAFIHHTKLVGKEKYNGKEVYYIGTYVPHNHRYFDISEKEIYNLWFSYLKKIYPEFNRDKIIDKKIFKLKYAQHIVDLDYEQKIPEHDTPLPNIYLANFSQIFPEDRGTNFAVRDGIRIAEEVISKTK